jgi:hypothetical protein
MDGFADFFDYPEQAERLLIASECDHFAILAEPLRPQMNSRNALMHQVRADHAPA